MVTLSEFAEEHDPETLEDQQNLEEEIQASAPPKGSMPHCTAETEFFFSEESPLK